MSNRTASKRTSSMLLALSSTILCIVVIVIFVRSYFVTDIIRMPGRLKFYVVSSRGSIEFHRILTASEILDSMGAGLVIERSHALSDGFSQIKDYAVLPLMVIVYRLDLVGKVVAGISRGL